MFSSFLFYDEFNVSIFLSGLIGFMCDGEGVIFALPFLVFALRGGRPVLSSFLYLDWQNIISLLFCRRRRSKSPLSSASFFCRLVMVLVYPTRAERLPLTTTRRRHCIVLLGSEFVHKFARAPKKDRQRSKTRLCLNFE